MNRVIRHRLGTQRGISMLEVIIAIVITAFGLLGLAGLMSRMQVAEVDGFQRSQALALLSDMTERISAAMPGSNPALTVAQAQAEVNAYVTGTGSGALGTGDTQPASCAGKTGAALDLCEWSNELKGAAETDSGGNQVGAMIGARGCIELAKVGAGAVVQQVDNTLGVCTPATVLVTVVWQGLTTSAAPATACGSGNYGGSNLTRATAAQVTVGLHDCTTP